MGPIFLQVFSKDGKVRQRANRQSASRASYLGDKSRGYADLGYQGSDVGGILWHGHGYQPFLRMVGYYDRLETSLLRMPGLFHEEAVAPGMVLEERQRCLLMAKAARAGLRRLP